MFNFKQIDLSNIFGAFKNQTQIGIKKIIVVTLMLILTNIHLKAEEIPFEKQTIATGISKNSGLISADLDNDGDMDLIGNSYGQNKLYWWRNDGGNPIVFTQLLIDDNYKGAQYVFAEDIDGDGNVDVMATAAVNDAQVAWWRNNGDDPITWTKEIIRENFGNAHGIYANDINGDGNTDIIATAAFDNLICWWENDGNYPVNWTEHIIDNNSPVSQSVTSVDIDKDGDNDVIATSENQVVLFKNDGGNPVGWTKQIIDNSCKVAHWVDYADVNNDGHIDVVACGYAEIYLRWYENDGSDTINWKEHIIPGKFFGSLTMAAADLNGDNRTDIIGTSAPRNELAWWSNDGGNPVVWTKHIINNFSYPWALVAEDIDGDGDKDVLTGSNTLGQVYLFKNNYSLTSTGNIEDNQLQEFKLNQNYPNPFNPSTNISFTIPEAGMVKLSVFNSIGLKIKTLIDDYYSAGSFQVAFDASGLSSGIYYYQLTTNNFSHSKSMVLLK